MYVLERAECTNKCCTCSAARYNSYCMICSTDVQRWENCSSLQTVEDFLNICQQVAVLDRVQTVNSLKTEILRFQSRVNLLCLSSLKGWVRVSAFSASCFSYLVPRCTTYVYIYIFFLTNKKQKIYFYNFFFFFHMYEKKML